MKNSLKIASVAITFLMTATLAKMNKETFMTMEQIAAKSGFATESYTLTTSDGYGL